MVLTNPYQIARGVPGADAGVTFLYSDTTTMANPGKGLFRLNNAALSSVTQMRLSHFEAVGDIEDDYPDIKGFVTLWAAGFVLIRKKGAAQFLAYYSITSKTNLTAHIRLDLTHLSSNQNFQDLDECLIQWIPSA